MATLIDIASAVQDLYEQNYPAADSFLNIDDFKFHVAQTYSEMLNVMYQAQRVANRQETGFSNIELSAAWLIMPRIKIERDEKEDKFFATLPYPVFSFDWDANANGLLYIKGIGCKDKKCKYRKISLNERPFLDITIPNSDIFYTLNAAKEIVFWGAKEGAEIEPQYIPAVAGLENDCLLSDSISNVLIDQVMMRFKKAKDGVVIQKANDQNPNNVMEQQVDNRLGR